MNGEVQFVRFQKENDSEGFPMTKFYFPKIRLGLAQEIVQKLKYFASLVLCKIGQEIFFGPS